MSSGSSDRTPLACDGFDILAAAYSHEQCDRILGELTQALHSAGEEQQAVRSDAGSIYAARNVLHLWPAVAEVWRVPALVEALARTLGPEFGLVRVLFFDKPPERTWSLPWHKDLTIAVREHRQPSTHFRKPTRKVGVPHVEASQEVLKTMLTARIHLDEVTEENGPLKVIPGSHLTGKELRLDDAQPRSILADRGDVLLMRPLLAHCSNKSHEGTARHRRILHLEFAASARLPDGYEWHDFIHS